MAGITRVVAAIATVAACFAQQPAPMGKPRAKTIHDLFVEDQADRDSPGGDMSKLDWSKIGPRDAARRDRVRAMLDSGELRTGADLREASFIFQHGSKPEDYLMAHILATAALAKGDTKSRWIAAATLDRYLHAVGQAQVFGTQYHTRNAGEPMTQEPFDRALVPGGLRAAFCVPNDKIQRIILEAFQHDRAPDLSRYRSELPCRESRTAPERSR